MSVVRSRAAAAAAIAVAMTVGYLAQGTYAAGTPANKVAASGSETEVEQPNAPAVALLTEHVKINNPTDLILSATAECSIVTQVKTTGAETRTATGSIKMWVTIDGKHVPVSDKDSDQGRVVFCNRVHQQETKLDGNEDDENDDYVRTFLSTREASGFNWMALNVGTNYPGTANNIHEVILWAQFETSTSTPTSTDTFARAIVGNRTLILEPVKSANREAVTEVG